MAVTSSNCKKKGQAAVLAKPLCAIMQRKAGMKKKKNWRSVWRRRDSKPMCF
jgi:hypothetical protein